MTTPERPLDNPTPQPVEYRTITRASNFIRWKDQPVGFTVEGVWLGAKPSKLDYGDLGTIKTLAGPDVNFGIPATLAPELARVPTGTQIRLQYDGMSKGKKGTSYHTFTLGVDSRVTVKARPDIPDEF
jgi:hypothetical protein